MFKLSRRKGASVWQVRKRWPLDCAPNLRGEFVRTTGETDRERAADMLPTIAAEFRAKVNEARAQVQKLPERALTETEARRMAADFYRSMLPSFTVRTRLEPVNHAEVLKIARDNLKASLGMLGANRYDPVFAAARTMMAKAGIAADEDSQELEFFQRMLMRAWVELHRSVVARLSGDADFAMHDSALLDVPAAAVVEPTKKTVADLLLAYENAKGRTWSASSKRVFGPVARLLREEFGGKAVDGITREEARAFADLLLQLPKGMGRRLDLRDLPAREAVEKGRALGIPPITVKTYNDSYMVHVVAVFNWALVEGWVETHSFRKLRMADPVSDEDRRDPFTSEQLREMFSSAPWGQPWHAERDHPGRFWGPLLCLHHGFRLREVIGLHVDDLLHEDGAALHIRPKDGQKLKTASSRAMIPVHPEILRLGFVEFVADLKARDEVRLFREEPEDGKGLSDWFSDYVKRRGFVGEKLGMPSFRHNFEDRLREAGIEDRMARALARRAEKGSSRGYGAGLSIRTKAAAIAKVVYPGLDLSHLYKRTNEQ